MDYIKNVYNEVKLSLKEQSYYSAFKNISELNFIIDEKKGDLDLDLDLNIFSQSQLRLINKKIEQDFDRINRIISIGSIYNEDEYLLLLTIRIQLDLGFKYLKKINVNTNFDLSGFDELLRNSIDTKVNAISYNTSLTLIRKNWTTLTKEYLLKILP